MSLKHSLLSICVAGACLRSRGCHFACPWGGSMQLRGSRSGCGSLGLCLGMVALLGVAGCGPEGAGGNEFATVSSSLQAEAPEQDFPGDEEYTVCPSTEPDCDASFEDDEPVEVPDPPCTVPPCPLLPTDPGY